MKTLRIQELVSLLNMYSYHYHVLDKPLVTDKEYDKIYNELETLEKETNYILSDSPTQKVQGEILPFLKKISHSEPMLSADKTKETSDIIKFMNNKECILSWKLDGLTIVLRYQDGELIQAITRGDGIDGEDVTHTVKTFTNIPLKISFKGYLEVRGEGLLSFKEFKRINQEMLDKQLDLYANCRNLASGSVRQLDASVTKSRKLHFKSFNLVEADGMNLKFKDEQLEFLKNIGLTVVDYVKVNVNNVIYEIEKFKNKISDFDFATDGLIVEFNDVEYGKSLGSTGKFCRNLLAFKWFDETSETIFRGVEMNTTRTGIVSLTALFDPTQIEGTTVARATLHNLDIFESHKLGIGDTISVYKANMIIPQIDDNLTRSNTFKVNMFCPCCNSPLEIIQPDNTRFLHCPNPECEAKLTNRIDHFCSKKCMNIVGLSIETITKFVELGYLKDLSDVFKLEQYENEIISLSGFGSRSYEKIIKSIEIAKEAEFSKFIAALGIKHVGESTAKKVSDYLQNDINNFIGVKEDKLLNVGDVGEETARSISIWFDTDENITLIKELLTYIKFKTMKIDNEGLKNLEGLIFCCTGNVETFEKRDELKALILSLGGKFSSSVSAKTNYLITNDPTSGSSKNADARKFNVPIITEIEFNELIGRKV